MPRRAHAGFFSAKSPAAQLSLSSLSHANSRLVPFVQKWEQIDAEPWQARHAIHDDAYAVDTGSLDSTSESSCDEADGLFERVSLDSAPTTPEVSGDESSDFLISLKAQRRGATVRLPQRVSSLTSSSSSSSLSESWQDPNSPLAPPLAPCEAYLGPGGAEDYSSPLSRVGSRDSFVTAAEYRRVPPPAYEPKVGEDIYTLDVATRVRLYEARLAALASLSPSWWIEQSADAKIGRAQFGQRCPVMRVAVPSV